jgi:putative phage-type endonuclease
LEKTGQAPHQEAGEAAYWGTRLESLIREEFTLRTGIKIITVNQILQSREYPFMLANLDGVCRCPIHGKCVFEAKTANAFKAGEWEGDSVPQEYILQTQHYLSVTGYNGAYIAVLIGGNTFKSSFIKRDEEIISMLIKRERDFWTLVQDDIPPPPDGSDACVKYLSERYPNSVPTSKIILPAAASDLIRQYNTASEQADVFTEQKQKAANLLKQMLGENKLGVAGDSYVKWQTVSQERFSAKMLEAEQPDIYAKYTVKSSHRRFTVKAAVKTDENSTIHEQLSREAG